MACKHWVVRTMYQRKENSMWLMTPVGFFSIVCKAEDKKTGTLTIRSRVREDLLALHATVLPGMGAILENVGDKNSLRHTDIATKRL